MKTLNRQRQMAFAFGLALIVSSCGGSDSSDSASAGAAPTESSEATPADTTAEAAEVNSSDTGESDPETDEPETDEPETDDSAGSAAATTESDDDAAGSGGDCIVGTWVADSVEMQGFYDAISASNAGEFAFEIDGQMVMSFGDDGAFTYTPAFDLALEVTGIEASGSTTGTASGTYEAGDGVITTELTDSNISLSITAAGITIDGDTLGNDLLTSLPINSAPYACGDEGPEIEFETGADATHTVHLKPA